MAPSTVYVTTLHPFSTPNFHSSAYEWGVTPAKNALVFVGGLGDGPHTVPYPFHIAKELETHPDISYTVFEMRLRSSFSGFGFASLADDVADISAFVQYLRGIGKEKVVLMGHSTGSQDLMEYMSSSYNNAPVEGLILQACVSDRGAFEISFGEQRLKDSIKVAKELIDSGNGSARMPVEHMPKEFRGAVSANRWYSLTAVDGEDNYFSHDLPKDVAAPLWQRIDKPLLIVPSAEDEYVPGTVDQEALIKEWKSMCRPGIASDLSACIPGATHRVDQPDSQKWLADRVVRFLSDINQVSDSVASAL
ncbi:dolichol-phosphate mannosyltransferase [Xylariales sp. PMI_506]|nr:dolichol-phosphate mannosyltransferase [Xylariales sp. PMI_506]